MVHRRVCGAAHACAACKTSSRMLENDEAPVSRKCISNQLQQFVRDVRTFRATSFQNTTMSSLPSCCRLRYSRKRTKKTTSSSVNATPLPVVLLYSARGGVGDRVRWTSAATARYAAAIAPGPWLTGGGSSSCPSFWTLGPGSGSGGSGAIGSSPSSPKSIAYPPSRILCLLQYRRQE